MTVYYVLGLFLLLSGQILALDDEIKQKIKALHDACVAETGVDEALIAKCNTGQFTDDPKLKCYIKCLLKTSSMMTDQGEIDVDAAIAILPKEYVETAVPILRGCGTVKGTDDCDTAYQTHLCYYSKNPEFYYLM